jgi:hypothetical protein
MAKQTVALYTVTSGDRVSRARDSLAEALGDAQLGEPDDGGSFEVALDAESPEEAIALVREAFRRAGTGNDFVIREGTEGREMPAGDPRQAGEDETPTTAVGAGDDAEVPPDDPAPASDRASSIADAASAVAAAASSARAGDSDAAREAATTAAEAARTAAAEAAEAVRAAASSAREAVDEKGVGGAASDYASGAATAAQKRDWSQFAPIGAGLLLLIVLRRMRR